MGSSITSCIIDQKEPVKVDKKNEEEEEETSKGFVCNMATSANIRRMTNDDDDRLIQIAASRPLPGMITPNSFAFAPNGSCITFLTAVNGGLLQTLHNIPMNQIAERLMSSPSSQDSPSLISTPFVEASDNQFETESNLSLEEKLRRERTRNLNIGITAYSWACIPSLNNLSFVLIPLGGDLYIRLPNSSELVLLYNHLENSYGFTGPCVDAEVSPTGENIAFVQDKELCYIPVRNFIISRMDIVLKEEDGLKQTSTKKLKIDRPQPIRLTFTATKDIANGLADYLAQEELERLNGFWWSPDGNQIAFEQYNESKIPFYSIQHQGKDEVSPSDVETHRYPFTGQLNPIVSLGVISLKDHHQGGLTIRWLDLPSVENRDQEMKNPGQSYYLARVCWNSEKTLMCQILNREQTELRLVAFDVESQKQRLVLKETSETWINLHDLFVQFQGSRQDEDDFFIWGSERSGFMHLYLYRWNESYNGEAVLVRALTQGAWVCEKISAIDSLHGIIYAVGNYGDLIGSHAVMIDYEESVISEPVCLTHSFAGSNSVNIDLLTNLVLLTRSSVTLAPSISIHQLPSGTELRKLFQTPRPTIQHSLEVRAPPTAKAISPVNFLQTNFAWIHNPREEKNINYLALESLSSESILAPPELFSFRLGSDKDDDDTEIYGSVYLPNKEKHGSGPYPLIDFVYGGPHVQRVRNEWLMTCDMRAQRFTSLGYAVMKCDNRGSSRRGVKFEGPIRYCMGSVEITDQVSCVQYLVNRGIADPNRVGLIGWSYGGYMSILGLLKEPSVFRVAVAGAPVTSWKLYDTAYTERYMGTPDSNPKGYEQSSCITHVDNLQGKLMLIHGLIDENVLFRHTAAFINELISKRKSYDLLLLPDERHAPRTQKGREYMEFKISEYFQMHL